MKQLPSEQEIKRIRLEAKENRAIEAYKFFYPTVSMVSNFDTLEKQGAAPNKGMLLQLSTSNFNVLTQNSDTPYGLFVGNTEDDGPLVIELPKGPIMGVVDDTNFKYVADLGLTGEDKGAGAKYLFLPPGYEGEIPEGYLVRKPASYRFLVALRAVIPGGTKEQEFGLLQATKFYPLKDAAAPKPNDYQDVSDIDSLAATPYFDEGRFSYWEVIKRVLDTDCLDPEYYQMYGFLADIGLEKGKPFEPDAEMKALLTRAAEKANEQMAVNAFANDAEKRLVWPGKQWEWVVFGDGDNGYYADGYLALSIRERWFYQATLETPKMFMRQEGAGSLYWLGVRSKDGAALDGGKSYSLKVPFPVPAKLFWSVTVYDIDTRSEIVTSQPYPVLSSLRRDFTPGEDGLVTLYFGPEAPEDKDLPWLQTVPGRGWFVYFRIYGPEKSVFDDSWQLEDFEEISK